MAKRGIAQVTGPKSIKLGETARYWVSKIYRKEDDEKVPQARWKLYVKEGNGFRELRPVAGTPPKVGSETTITITNQQLLGKELLLEAYLYAPEISSPPGILIKVEEGAKKIERVDLFRADDTPIGRGETVKYGQSITAKVITLNMPYEEVEITLYEDDESGGGHHANNEKNKIASVTKRLDKDGFTMHTFNLPIDINRIANAYMDGTEDRYHEYYIHVKSAQGARTSDNINVPNPDYIFPEQEIEAVEITVKAKGIGTDPMPDTGKSASIVQEEKIENLLDAYFAKKEYTKQTGEEVGALEYTFAGNGNNTRTTAQKENIAKIILGKPAITTLKDKKQYTTLEAIKAALTQDVYNKNEKINIKTFKLGEEFKRVNNAPLEEKLYLVATTSMLEGKEASLTIKEKDGIIKGSAGALLPVLEITEEQMEQKSRSGEVAGTEKTEFKGMVKEGMVRIPIHLRPKSDDELKQWKEKLARGKQDGTYTYTFANQTVLPNGSGDEKKRVAGIILTNAREGKPGNPKMEAGKVAFVEDVYEALTEERYAQGDTIRFPLYKKEKELLYLQAKAQGEKQHDKEFLNQEGMYFEVGKKCECEERIRAFIRMIRIGEGTGELIKSRDKVTKEIIYIPNDFDKGYTTAFAGNKITDLSTHPQIIYKNNPNDAEGSSAAGAYQVMRYTWWELAGFEVVNKKKTGRYFEERDLLKKYKILDYSPESQDKICIALMKKQRPNLIDKIIANKIKEAIQEEACYIWASLPETETESHYFFNGKRQPATPLKVCIEHYESFLKDEISGNSKLYLKPGFLKDFNITCCEGTESNDICKEDYSQCFNYEDVISNPRLNNQSDNVNKNRWRREKRYNSTYPQGYYHTGTDILASSGTAIKSMMCGIVHDLVNTFAPNEYRANSLGNYIVIKSKDRNGEDVYIKYCHLDEVTAIKGQKVKHGESIGKAGSTGNAASVYRNGRLIHGINPVYRHVHIEAARSSFFGSTRIDPEQFMKTKFDETKKGNPL